MITIPDGALIRIRAVKTPDGHRIRLTISGDTIDTTHLKAVQLVDAGYRTTDLQIDSNGVLIANSSYEKLARESLMGVTLPAKP